MYICTSDDVKRKRHKCFLFGWISSLCYNNVVTIKTNLSERKLFMFLLDVTELFVENSQILY